MKKVLFIWFLGVMLAFGVKCQEKKDTILNTIEHVERKYIIGDINNDKIVDTATVIYDRVIATIIEDKIIIDSLITLDCGKPECNIKIKFSSNIPELNINAFDLFIDSVVDVNGDGANEILLFCWWVRPCWIDLDVFSFKNKVWDKIAATKAFIGDADDSKNRIIKKGSRYFLIGDEWNRNYTGIIKTKTKINKK